MTTGTETDRSKDPSVGCTSLDLRQSARQYFGTIPLYTIARQSGQTGGISSQGRTNRSTVVCNVRWSSSHMIWPSRTATSWIVSSSPRQQRAIARLVPAQADGSRHRCFAVRSAERLPGS